MGVIVTTIGRREAAEAAGREAEEALEEVEERLRFEGVVELLAAAAAGEGAESLSEAVSCAPHTCAVTAISCASIRGARTLAKRAGA